MSSPHGLTINQDTLEPFKNAAGHDGVMAGADEEVVVKPCTQAEIDFYQETLISHADFAQYMPAFMGTLTLGPPQSLEGSSALPAEVEAFTAQEPQPAASGKKIATETAIVLENLEWGFTHPNVIDLKLGSRLWAPGTKADKAARLDKVAAETTSGSLKFRIAGMKVWNTETESYDMYDKMYGRAFNADSIHSGFSTFFDTVVHVNGGIEVATQVIDAIREGIEEMRQMLERKESRFFSASILIVYEGDQESLAAKVEKQSTEQTAKVPESQAQAADGDEDDDEDEAEDESPIFRLKLIDFAHSTWCPGQGKDVNVITGLSNIETQLKNLVEKISNG